MNDIRSTPLYVLLQITVMSLISRIQNICNGYKSRMTTEIFIICTYFTCVNILDIKTIPPRNVLYYGIPDISQSDNDRGDKELLESEMVNRNDICL